MKLTTELVEKNSRRSMYLVRGPEGAEVGLLEKYRNSRTDKHPWKAFIGVGYRAEFLGAFYTEDGGKTAALEAISIYAKSIIPVVPLGRKVTVKKAKPGFVVHIVDDSVTGWADAVREVLEGSLQGIDVILDYTEIRPRRSYVICSFNEDIARVKAAIRERVGQELSANEIWEILANTTNIQRVDQSSTDAYNVVVAAASVVVV